MAGLATWRISWSPLSCRGWWQPGQSTLFHHSCCFVVCEQSREGSQIFHLLTEVIRCIHLLRGKLPWTVPGRKKSLESSEWGCDPLTQILLTLARRVCCWYFGKEPYREACILAGEYNIFPSQNKIMLNMLLGDLIFFGYKYIFSCQYSVEFSFIGSFTNLFNNRKRNALSTILHLLLVRQTDNNQIIIPNHTNSERSCSLSIQQRGPDLGGNAILAVIWGTRGGGGIGMGKQGLFYSIKYTIKIPFL